jgi:MFS family permease
MNIWTQLGVSAGITAVFAILLAEYFQQTDLYRVARWYAFAVFIAAGVVLSLLGFLRPAARLKRDQNTGQETDENNSGAQIRFWGPIFILFACVVLVIPFQPKELPVAARVVRTNQTSALVATVPAPAPEVSETNAVFPEIKIQGLVYRPPNNAVIIKGRSYFVGDNIENARLFAIYPTGIVLEIDGHYQTVPIDPVLQPRNSTDSPPPGPHP